MSFRRWTNAPDERGSRSWGFHAAGWRLQLRVLVFRHCYPDGSPDRWVLQFQPSYDRKARKP